MDKYIKYGGPAFPMQYADDSFQTGMTLRDYFAAKAMHAKMLCDAPVSYPLGMTVAQYVAQQAYAMADAMLDARNG